MTFVEIQKSEILSNFVFTKNERITTFVYVHIGAH